MRTNFDFGYLGDYLYKGWILSIYRNLDGTYNGRSQGYSCYTKSQRSIKLKRKFRLWVNSLPEEAFIDIETIQEVTWWVEERLSLDLKRIF